MTDEIHCIPKGKGAEIRIQKKLYKGKDLVDVRVWFLPRDSDEFIPTGKGVTFAPEHVGVVIAALEQCVA